MAISVISDNESKENITYELVLKNSNLSNPETGSNKLNYKKINELFNPNL
jgi:hypothetical protein